jgi:hypothetical protein
MNTETLERKLDKLRRKEGLIGGSLKVVPIKPSPGHLAAAINTKTWHTEFSVDPKWEVDEDVQIYSALKGIDDAVSETCMDAIRHEINHWKACPFNFENHDRILDATFRGLRDTNTENLDEAKLRENAIYAANMYEDLVVNANCRQARQFAGIPVFFYDQGTAIGTYNPLFEVHVKTNLGVWGDSLDKELVSKFYRINQKMNHPMGSMLNSVIGKKLDDKVEQIMTTLDLKGRSLEDAVNRLNRTTSWERDAYEFAKIVSELFALEKSSGKGGGEGEGQSTREKLGPNPSSFDKGIEDAKTQEKIIKGRSEAGKPMPSYMNPAQVQDMYYNALASEVILKARTKGQGWDMPLVTASHEDFNPEEHTIEEVDFSRVSIDPNGFLGKNINFQVPRHHHTVQVPYREAKERVPNIMFLSDCSGSMTESTSGTSEGRQVFDLPWRDRSKYHFAMLGKYGSLKWLQNQGIAPYLLYNATLFSNTTRSSGWKNYSQLGDFKKMLFAPEFGGTSINNGVLARELNVSPALILMLSDGAIWRWSDIKDRFREITDPHYLSLIQIGEPTQTTKDIESWGKRVYQVNKAEDLRGMIVDVTKQSVRNYLGGFGI